MIQELLIKNFAIIEEQRVEFEQGLNIFSGETGSGKSLVLQAFEMVLGGRASSKYFRKGTEQWQIDARFDLSRLDPKIRERLPDIAKDDELFISRAASRNGKGRVLINGHLASVKMLEAITAQLMNICSQGQQLDLVQPSFQRELLDSYGVSPELLSQYREAYRAWREAERKHGSFAQEHARRVQRRLELESLLGELEPIEQLLGRRTELEDAVRREQLREREVEVARNAWNLLIDDTGILAQMGVLSRGLNELERLTKDSDSLRSHLLDAEAHLDELERSLRQICESEGLDPERLEQLRDELAELARLERKYRADGPALSQILAAARDELSEIGEEVSLAEVEQALKDSLAKVEAISQTVTRARKKAAESLGAEINAGLASLNMEKARLQVEVVSGDLAEHGGDAVIFLFSPNPGEEAKELGQIASGGELSRLLLLLKTVLRDRAQVNVLVFDEVDTGISGAVARAVGEKLKSLSTNSQVICITHLAQVASFADCHLTVEKSVEGRTRATIRTLNEEERVEEIARMLAGYQVTPAARASARELLTSKSL